MPRLRVPSRFKDGFDSLSRLSESEREALLSGLNTRPETLSLAKLATKISTSVPSLTSTAEDVAEVLVSLWSQAHNQDWSEAEVAEHLQEAAGLDVPEEGRPTLIRLVAALLQAESVAITAKAVGLIGDQQRLFTNARILTDIRPLFGEGDEPSLLGMIVIHTLRLDFFTTHEHQVFFVGMDDADLRNLAKAVDRAQGRAGTLKESIRSVALPYFEVEEE